MKIVSAVVALATMLTSSQVFAVSDVNRSIAVVGSQGTGFVQFKEGLSQPCKFGTVYLPDLSLPNAKGMMVVLISAQARGALVAIGYDIDANNICTANTVSAQ
jgi:hypothetical protein